MLFQMLYTAFFSLQLEHVQHSVTSDLSTSNTLSNTLSVEDNEVVEALANISQSTPTFAPCLIPNCTGIAEFGFKDSEHPFLCSVHCYDDMVNFNAAGVYNLYSYSCFSNTIRVRLYYAILVSLIISNY
jgi:hypothetical protein